MNADNALENELRRFGNAVASMPSIVDDVMIRVMAQPLTVRRPRRVHKLLVACVAGLAACLAVAITAWVFTHGGKPADTDSVASTGGAPRETLPNGLATRDVGPAAGDVAGAAWKAAHRLGVTPSTTILVSTGPKDPLDLGQQTKESATTDWYIHVWDLAKGGKSRVLGIQVPEDEDFALSPEGNLLVTAKGRAINLIDGKEKVLEGFANVTRVCFSPDGKTLLALAGPLQDSVMRVYDWPTMKLRAQLPDQLGYNMCTYAFSTDSRLVALVDKDRKIRIWNLETGTIVMTTEKALSNSAQSLALSPDGKRLVSSSAGPNAEILLWDATTGKHLSVLDGKQQCGTGMGCFVFSPDSKLLVGGGVQNLVVWDVASGQVLQRFDSSSGGSGAAWFSPNQTEILTIRNFYVQRTEEGKEFDVYPSLHRWTIQKETPLLLAATAPGRSKIGTTPLSGLIDCRVNIMPVQEASAIVRVKMLALKGGVLDYELVRVIYGRVDGNALHVRTHDTEEDVRNQLRQRAQESKKEVREPSAEEVQAEMVRENYFKVGRESIVFLRGVPQGTNPPVWLACGGFYGGPQHPLDAFEKEIVDVINTGTHLRPEAVPSKPGTYNLVECILSSERVVRGRLVKVGEASAQWQVSGTLYVAPPPGQEAGSAHAGKRSAEVVQPEKPATVSVELGTWRARAETIVGYRVAQQPGAVVKEEDIQVEFTRLLKDELTPGREAILFIGPRGKPEDGSVYKLIGVLYGDPGKPNSLDQQDKALREIIAKIAKGDTRIIDE